jgi:hypothetical protein
MHAPGHLRDAFIGWVESGRPSNYVVPPDYFDDGEPRSISWLFRELWRCSDVIPSDVRDDLGMEGVFTYGDAARQLA